jgi:hypothetical protein
MQDPQDTEQLVITTLDSWLGPLRLGEPLSEQALALVPVYTERQPTAPRYRPLEQAIAAGDVAITEAPHATVPTLQVQNRSVLPVLILDGEEVVGGRQNRVINTTLLVPTNTIFPLPVSCVEHGRWHEARPVFDAGETAYPGLRRQKVQQVAASYAARGMPMADQSAVWGEIADRHRRIGSHSPTGAMRDAYVERAHDLARAEEVLRCPEDGPVGVVALVGGRAICADIFDSGQTLRTYWTRLVRSYALEALGAAPTPPSRDSAQRLLHRPLRARRTAFRSPGLGLDVRISGDGIVGAALVHEDAVVHTALFRSRADNASGPGISRPSARARRFGS